MEDTVKSAAATMYAGGYLELYFLILKFNI